MINLNDLNCAVIWDFLNKIIYYCKCLIMFLASVITAKYKQRLQNFDMSGR